MRPESDIEAELRDDENLDRIAKTGKAGTEYAFASRVARRVCEEAGLNATFTADGAHFTPWQTAKAVRHAREDVAATLLLQHAILKRLDRVQVYCWIGLALLAYIAFRLS